MASQALIKDMTDDQFGREAFALLAREYGVAGVARFIRLYRSGPGDYTAERHQWLDKLTVDDLAKPPQI